MSSVIIEIYSNRIFRCTVVSIIQQLKHVVIEEFDIDSMSSMVIEIYGNRIEIYSNRIICE